MTTPVLTYKPRVTGVHVDLDRLIASRCLIQANSGGGKSRAIRQMLEETHGRVQHLVIDPEGEFPTLREKFDYVLAAKHGGEALASPKLASKLCRRLVELGASAVLDLYELSLDDRRAFVEFFLTELMALPRSLWHPIIVVIDEMHVFAPESGESRAAGAVTALATQGRKRGFCLVGATQRISKLDKDVAAELLNKMIGRTGLDIDVKRAGDELGMGKEERNQLKTLAPGEFFVYGPAIANEVQIVRTGDVVTSHPEAGKVGTAPPPPTAKVRAMLAEFADLPKEAEEEARTLEAVRALNAKLNREIRQLQTTQRVVEKPVTVVDQKAIERAVATAVKPYRTLIGRVQTQMLGVVQAVKALPDRLESVVVTLGEVEKMNGHHVSSEPTAERATPVPVRATNVVHRATKSTSGASDASEQRIGKTPQRMLNALLFFERIGVSQPTRAQLAGFVGISPSTGTFRNYLSELRSFAFINDLGTERVELTEAGREQASEQGLPRSVEELHRTWRAKFGSTPARMFDVLIEAYPNSVSREDLAAAVNVDASTGTFRNYLSELRSPGALEDVTKTEVRAADMLFPEGLG